MPIKLLAKAKVSKFEVSLLDQDVLRLQVSVHDVMLPQHFEPLDQLVKNLKRSLLLNSPIFLDHLVQSSSLAELINKIAIIPCLQQLVEPDDKGTWFEPVVNCQLVIDVFFDFCILCKYFVADNLDGEEPTFLEVFGLEDFAVRACAKQLSQFILADHPPYLHIVQPRTIFHIEFTSILRIIAINKQSADKIRVGLERLLTTFFWMQLGRKISHRHRSRARLVLPCLSQRYSKMPSFFV